MTEASAAAFDFGGVFQNLRARAGFAAAALRLFLTDQSTNLAFFLFGEIAGIAALLAGASEHGLHFFHETAGLDGAKHVFAAATAQAAVAAAKARIDAASPRGQDLGLPARQAGARAGHIEAVAIGVDVHW